MADLKKLVGNMSKTSEFMKAVDKMSAKSLIGGLNRHKLSRLNLDKALPLPDFKLPPIPTPAEQHAYESAGTLIGKLAARIKCWQQQIPPDAQPVILAILTDGTSIRVSRLFQQGHNGILVEGKVGDAPCMVLAHQATLQLLCYVEHMEDPEKEIAPIGFDYYGKEDDEAATKTDSQ